MILRLVHAGQASRGPLGDAAEDYRRRLSRHLRCDEIFVKPAPGSDRPADVARALASEADRLLGRIQPDHRLVALVVGPGQPSEVLAKRLQAWMNSGQQAIVFALGSAHGLHGRVIERADETWSFGPATLPHDLARTVLWEQLYRASTILRGEPYHK
jgi:23S rRNA (pseudouridine1915-N3)-methyltransferase